MTPLAPPPTLPPLREIIETHGLAARKSLGQHFLLDTNLTDKIARAAGPMDGVTVMEVGPGPGGLTRSLLAQGAQVIAIEQDARFIKALSSLSEAYPGRLHLIEDDALKIDEMAHLANHDTRTTKLVSNLPYNVGTALLIKWLSIESWPPWYASMTLMFQKEVADRITAHPGSKSYGRLSVLCQWRCQVDKVFDVPARAFTPPPKVDSSVVHFTPNPHAQDHQIFLALEKVTQAAFGQRRKMLRASLKSVFPSALETLEQLEIDPTLRAENLTIPDFEALAKALIASD